jgi:hypothetical protein
VGIFVATVAEDALSTNETWAKAALQALEGSEVSVTVPKPRFRPLEEARLVLQYQGSASSP